MKYPLLLAGITLALCACTTTAPTAEKPMNFRWESARMTWIELPGTAYSSVVLINTANGERLLDTECTGIVSTGSTVEGATTSARCRWAGVGMDYAVFLEDGEYVIRYRTVDEETGFGEWAYAGTICGDMVINTETDSTECTKSTNTDTPVAAKRVEMEWSVQTTGTASNGAPHNILTLRPVSNSGEVLYRTECDGTTLAEGVQDMGNSIASIQCWWAGGGDQFGVYIDEKEQILIRHRTVDEDAGYGEWDDVNIADPSASLR